MLGAILAMTSVSRRPQIKQISSVVPLRIVLIASNVSPLACSTSFSRLRVTFASRSSSVGRHLNYLDSSQRDARDQSLSNVVLVERKFDRFAVDEEGVVWLKYCMREAKLSCRRNTRFCGYLDTIEKVSWLMMRKDQWYGETECLGVVKTSGREWNTVTKRM